MYRNENKCTKQTSFDERALLVKSLQQEVKHFSTRLAYNFKKSCICQVFQRQNGDPFERSCTCRFSMTFVIWACSAELKFEKSMAIHGASRGTTFPHSVSLFPIWRSRGARSRLIASESLRSGKIETPSKRLLSLILVHYCTGNCDFVTANATYKCSVLHPV